MSVLKFDLEATPPPRKPFARANFRPFCFFILFHPCLQINQHTIYLSAFFIKTLEVLAEVLQFVTIYL